MTEISGNLIELAKNGEFDIIIQGCNCFCTMGKGLAKDIRENFYPAFEADQNTVKGDRSKIGSYSSALCSVQLEHSVKEVLVINAYTQYNYANSSSLKKVDLFNYQGFEKILKTINKNYPGKTIGIPQIGAGLAGGNWDRIKTIIEENLPDLTVNIVYYGTIPVSKPIELSVGKEIKELASQNETAPNTLEPNTNRKLPINRFTFKR